MGQLNDKRVSRVPSWLPDYSRDDTVKAALDALFEEDTGVGYSEITYISTVFTSKLETWTDNTKVQKRSETNFTYSPLPFVSQVVKTYYQDDGITPYYTITVDITYNANKTVNTINVDTNKTAGP